MRNVLKILGIIAFIAVIGFSMVTCDNGGGGSGKIPVKFRFSGTNKPQRQSASVKSRSVNVIKPLASVGVSEGVPGSEKLDELYSEHLGNKIESITPNKLQMVLFSLFLVGEEVEYDGDKYSTQINLIDSKNYKLVNLAQPITFVTEEVLAGTYRLVYFSYFLNGFGDGENDLFSIISFPWPQDINFENHYLRYENGYRSKKPNDNNGNIETDLQVFSPYQITQKYNYEKVLGFSSLPFEADKYGYSIADIDTIYMGGSSYRMINVDVTANKESLNFKDIDNKLPDFQLDNVGGSIIVPLNDGNGINIPENAKAVRFEICWDLDGLIERYEGATTSVNDDIFILKNGFWNAFSIRAVIEYSDSE